METEPLCWCGAVPLDLLNGQSVMTAGLTDLDLKPPRNRPRKLSRISQSDCKSYHQNDATLPRAERSTSATARHSRQQ
jgi:hypothetical protein